MQKPEILWSFPIRSGLHRLAATTAHPISARQAVRISSDVRRMPLGTAGVEQDNEPDNIYIVARDHNPEFLKVLDFGIAKLRDSGGQTKAGLWLGTPGYMSPEQWQTIPDIDGRADIYALGIILYECLTGRLPYVGQTPYDWLNAHLTHPVPDSAAVAPMPPILSQLIQRMMAKRREDRPQSMAEIISELERCAVQRTNPWVPRVPLEPAAGQRRSGSLELISAHMRSPVAQSSTLRSGIGEVVEPSFTVQPAKRLLPYVLSSVGGAVLCLGLLGGAYGLGFLSHIFSSPDSSKGDATSKSAMAPASTSSSKADESAAVSSNGARSSILPNVHKASADVLPEELVVLGPGRLSLGAAHHNPAPDSGNSVEIPRFAIGKYEITVGEFQGYAAATGQPPPALWDGAEASKDRKNLPMTLVNREQAENYCHWRYGLWGGRLPSETEWEFAARDGRANRRYPWHSKRFQPEKVNAGANRLRLIPVTSLPEGATDHGLLNMVGNAAEWTASDGEPFAGKGPGPSGRLWAVVRGGSADSPLAELSATARSFMPAEGRYPAIGFRCAANVANASRR